MDVIQQRYQNGRFYRKESELRHRILKATLLSDLEELKIALEALEERSFVEDVRLFGNPTPLYHFTRYNQMVWDTAYWGREGAEQCPEVVRWMEWRTAEVSAFWRDYLGVDELPEPDYRKYASEDFRAAYDWEDEEDILNAPKAFFIAQGAREIDLDLYVASARFDYDRVEELLQQGADPQAELCYDEEDEEGFAPSDWAYNKIGSEEGWLSDNLWGIFEESHAGKKVEVDWIDFEQLLGLAAYIKMLKLFDRYRPLWNKAPKEPASYD